MLNYQINSWKLIVLQGVSCIMIMIIVVDFSFKLGFINREKEFSRFSIFNLLRNLTPPLTTKWSLKACKEQQSKESISRNSMKKEATVYPIHKSQGSRHWNKIFLLNLGWYTFNQLYLSFHPRIWCRSIHTYWVLGKVGFGIT